MADAIRTAPREDRVLCHGGEENQMSGATPVEVLEAELERRYPESIQNLENLVGIEGEIS